MKAAARPDSIGPDARGTSIEVRKEKCATSHQRLATFALESEERVWGEEVWAFHLEQNSRSKF
jgi:hypothetical protein